MVLDSTRRRSAALLRLCMLATISWMSATIVHSLMRQTIRMQHYLYPEATCGHLHGTFA